MLGSNRTSLSGSSELIRSVAMSVKDVAQSEFGVIQKIFHQPSGTSKGCRLSQLDDLISKLSKDEDRILDACHEHFLHTRFFDDSQLSKVNQAYDWLVAADLWSGKYPLQRYHNIAPIKISTLFSSPVPGGTNPVPIFKAQIERSQRLRRNEAILRTYQTSKADFQPADELLLSKIPLLLQIIKPHIKAPNPQLLRPAEKLQLTRLVDIMVSEKISFIETTVDAVHSSLILEPPLDMTAKLLPEPIRVNQYESAIRKMIASEISQEAIKRTQSKSSKPADNTKPARRDFFGRPVTAEVIQEELTVINISKASRRICYKFNEGFSNAVRRNIKIRDLFEQSSIGLKE